MWGQRVIERSCVCISLDGFLFVSKLLTRPLHGMGWSERAGLPHESESNDNRTYSGLARNQSCQFLDRQGFNPTSDVLVGADWRSDGSDQPTLARRQRFDISSRHLFSSAALTPCSFSVSDAGFLSSFDSLRDHHHGSDLCGVPSSPKQAKGNDD